MLHTMKLNEDFHKTESDLAMKKKSSVGKDTSKGGYERCLRWEMIGKIVNFTTKM